VHGADVALRALAELAAEPIRDALYWANYSVQVAGIAASCLDLTNAQTLTARIRKRSADKSAALTRH
jgi:hypothetical protein